MRKIAICLLLSVVLSVFLVGCNNDSENDIREKQKKIIVNLRQEPPDLNTLSSYDGVSFNVINHVFEGLTRVDKNQNIVPAVAKHYTISEDNLTYTFYLRDCKWSDGSKIYAKDFEFAIKEVLNPKNLSEHASMLYMIKNAKKYNTENGLREDVGIIAKGDDILEITLENPCSYFLYLTSCSFFMPIKQEFYERQNETYAKTEQNMIYNGPFIIDYWENDKRILLSKNLNYWDSSNVKLNEIEMLMENNPEVEYKLFKQHKLDMIDVTGDILENAINDGYTVKKYLDGVTIYLEFNVNNMYLKNRNIRKAITNAIDVEEVCNNILKNGDIKAQALTNPVVKDGSIVVASQSKNLKKQQIGLAKEYLNMGCRELKIANTQDIEIGLLTQDSDTAIKEANYYKECIENNLGITVNLISLPFKENISKYKNGDFDLTVVCVSPDYNSPISYLDMLSTSKSLTYQNDTYDNLLEMAKYETNEKRRIEIFKEMENIIATDVPVYPLYYRHMNYIINPKIKDIERGAFREFDLTYAHY